MTLTEALLKSDGKIEKARKTIKSKRIGRLIQKPYGEVCIQEISGRQFNDIKAMSSRRDGTTDASKNYDSNLMCCMYGIVDPDLRNPALMEKFGVHTPKDLCEKIFAGEVYTIAAEIVDLSGIGSEEDEEEVKN